MAKEVKKKIVKKASLPADLMLREILDISYSDKFSKEVIEFVSGADEVATIDASQVSRVTTPCVQVFLSLFLKCYQENIVVKIKNPSNNFKLAFADLGLQDELNKYTI